MKIVKFESENEIKVKNIKGFMKRKVVISGTSAKVNCPKEFLGSDAILIILENEPKKKSDRTRRKTDRTRRKTDKSSSKNTRT